MKKTIILLVIIPHFCICQFYPLGQIKEIPNGSFDSIVVNKFFVDGKVNAEDEIQKIWRTAIKEVEIYQNNLLTSSMIAQKENLSKFEILHYDTDNRLKTKVTTIDNQSTVVQKIENLIYEDNNQINLMSENTKIKNFPNQQEYTQKKITVNEFNENDDLIKSTTYEDDLNNPVFITNILYNEEEGLLEKRMKSFIRVGGSNQVIQSSKRELYEYTKDGKIKAISIFHPRNEHANKKYQFIWKSNDECDILLNYDGQSIILYQVVLQRDEKENISFLSIYNPKTNKSKVELSNYYYTGSL